MTEYVIDLVLKRIPLKIYLPCHTRENLFIKIDKNGNVNIKQQYIHPGGEHSKIWDYLIINDNISIPSYTINMLINLFIKVPDGGGEFDHDHYAVIIQSIKCLKEDFAKAIDLL